MKSILDRSFEYTPAALTDVGRRFRRIWREQKLARQRSDAELREKLRAELRDELERTDHKVRSITR